MYVPQHFEESRVPVLHRTMREIGFATLVTIGTDGLIASHVPLLLDPEPTPFGTLSGHLARANSQWTGAASDVEALAIFLGPHAYVSPSWYPTKAESGKVVPTWNYVAIHAYGKLRLIDDPDWKLAHVAKLTHSHESQQAKPWAVSDAPPDFIRGMVNAIIGFELPIARLEGKWKMSQNRPTADQAGVVEALGRQSGNGAAVAAIIATRDEGKK
ncbi:MAG TPA: FMN-binding negative transcriptional regulator [Stellaceae bacterium]|nr:FMN-binding negative transcriptional regulator [Stellaceae bacterium]